MLAPILHATEVTRGLSGYAPQAPNKSVDKLVNDLLYNLLSREFKAPPPSRASIPANLHPTKTYRRFPVGGLALSGFSDTRDLVVRDIRVRSMNVDESTDASKQPFSRLAPPQLVKAGLAERDSSRVAPPEMVKAEEWEVGDQLPDLPPGTLIIKERDEDVWRDEKLEFNGLLADPRTPASLQAYIRSFQSPSDTYCHAFDGKGKTLSHFEWSAPGHDGKTLSDTARIRLMLGLLDAVNFLHGRGSAHLGLDATSIRVVPVHDPVSGDSANATGMSSHLELRLVGLGAAVRLSSSSGRSTYLMGNSLGFHAPELLNYVVVESNLRALYKFDSWAVGVLLMMIVGSLNASPYEADADWSRGIFSSEDGTRRKIEEVQSNLGEFLMELDGNSSGFLFRHGWVIKLIIGLLERDPQKRLFVHQAWDIATNKVNKWKRTWQRQKESRQLKRPVASADLVKFRAPLVLGKDGEPYRSLEAILAIASQGDAFVVLQKQRWPEVKNYGEIVGFRNRADGDRWDVFVPGLEGEIPKDIKLRLNAVLGVVLIRGGNHKIAVALDPPYATDNRDMLNRDIRTFVRVYAETHPSQNKDRIKYLSMEDLEQFGADSI